MARFKTVFLCTTLALGYASCNQEESDTSEEENTEFDGSGQVGSWGQYVGQDSTLLAMLTSPTDFVDTDEEFRTGSMENVQNTFDNGYPRGQFMSPSTISVNLDNASGLNAILTNSRVGLDFSESSYDDFTECLADLLAETTIAVKNGEFSFSIDVDASACYNEVLGSAYSDHTYRVQFSSYGQCLGKDFDSLNESTLVELYVKEEFEKSAFCAEAVSYATSAITTQSYTFTYTTTDTEGNDTSHSIDYTYTNTNGFYDANGKSCQRFKKDNSVLIENGCTNHELVEVVSTANGSEYTSKYYRSQTTSDLSMAYGDHDWFESGAMDTVYDGWTGTVTYSDPDTAPTWELTDGTDTITGDFVIEEE